MLKQSHFNLLALAALLVVVLAVPAHAYEALTGPTGVLKYKKGEAFEGYTLITPNVKTTKTWLVDMNGNIVHEWNSKYPAGLHAQLLPNGNLLRAGNMTKDRPCRFGGSGGIVQEFSWDGKLVWEYKLNDKNQVQHHTFKRLPNGNTLILGWERITKEEALKKGRDPRKIPSKPSMYYGLAHNDFWVDFVIEVNRAGKIVWKWRALDHVGTGKDQLDINYILPEGLGAPYTDFDWTHFNSVDYIPETDQIVMNSRNFSEFYLINHKTGKIEYRWGNPSSHGAGKRPTWYNDQSQKVFGSHHASYLGNGKMMIFDNGSERAEGNRSRSVIVDIKTGEIVWEYAANDSTSFFSYRQGASQMLPNGNVLITSSNHGHIFEVTKDKKVVWEFINPMFRGKAQCVVYDEDAKLKHNFMTNMIHRAYRYAPDYPGLKGKDLTPGEYLCGDDCPRFYETFHRGAALGGEMVADDDLDEENDEDLMMNAY